MTSARSTSLRWAAGVTVSLLALTACGGDDTGATPTTSSTTTTSASPKPSVSVTPSPSETAPSSTPTPSTSPSESATTKPIKVKVNIETGQVTTAADTVPVSPGDTISITVKTDTADTVHVHGIEQELELVPGTKNVLTFAIPADLAPGRYEVETHDNPLLLFMIEVS